MTGFGGHHAWGDGQALIHCLRGPAEVPIAGVGFLAAHNPRHRDGVSASGECAARRIPPSTL